MAFIATRVDENNEPETLGVARIATDPNNITAEFAIIVRSDLKGKGLGSILLKKLVDYCRDRGTAQIVGRVLPDNERMLALAERHGFHRHPQREEGVIEVCLPLTEEWPLVRERY
jgi:acetyltransferase